MPIGYIIQKSSDWLIVKTSALTYNAEIPPTILIHFNELEHPKEHKK
jgi:hypothetical protein